MLEDTYTVVNKIKVYNIFLNIPYYQGEAYEVKKECSVPIHMLQMLTIGKEVTLKINPKNRMDVYIQNEYGII
jgi:hypothetical protein